MSNSMYFPSFKDTATTLTYATIIGFGCAAAKIAFHRSYTTPQNSLSENVNKAAKSIFLGGVTGGVAATVTMATLSTAAFAMGDKKSSNIFQYSTPTTILAILGAGLVTGGILFPPR